MKKQASIILSLFALTFLAPATSALNIKDPQKHLEALDSFIDNPSFESVFQNYDWSKSLNRTCEYICSGNSCEKVCGSWEESLSVVIEVNNDSASIVTEFANGDESTALTITKDEFEAANRNLFRIFLSRTTEEFSDESFIRIGSLQEGTRVLLDGTVIEIAKVDFEFHAWIEDIGEFWVFPFTVSMGRDIPGVAQFAHIGASETEGTILAEFGRE